MFIVYWQRKHMVYIKQWKFFNFVYLENLSSRLLANFLDFQP